MRIVIVTALAVASCSTDQFITGDGGADATADSASDGEPSEGGLSADAGVDGCPYTNTSSTDDCVATGCGSGSSCCVSADAAVCSSQTGCPGAGELTLRCTRPSDCNVEQPLCCLEQLATINYTACPRVGGGGNITSQCASACEVLNDGGTNYYVRMCKQDTDCVGIVMGKCEKATLAFNPNVDFGVCQ